MFYNRKLETAQVNIKLMSGAVRPVCETTTVIVTELPYE